MSKKLPSSHYAKLAKQLRPLAKGFTAEDGFDLRKPLTPAQKGKLTRYANEARQLTSRENYLFRPRNKEHLKIAQDVAQHDSHFPGFKVAFIPWTKPLNSPEKRPNLKFKGKTIVIETSNYRKQLIPFDKQKLADDTELEIVSAADLRLIDELEKITNTEITTVTDLEIARCLYQAPAGATFQIQAGKYVVGQTYDSHFVAAEIKKLMAKYDGQKQVHDKKGWKAEHHEFSQWMNGIIAYKFKPGGPGQNSQRLLAAQNQAKLDRKMREKKLHKTEREAARRKKLFQLARGKQWN